MRTVAGQGVTRPSPDLLDTLYLCQRRQAWYREYALATGHDPLEFVGSLTCETPPNVAAERIKRALGLDSPDIRSQYRDWADALRHLISRIEDAGVLVMISGVVFSIEKVAEELQAGDDYLSDWAEKRDNRFFLDPDQQMLASLTAVSQWVQSQSYRSAAVQAFFSGR